MATNENDGPLAKLNKLLGIANDLPAIEQIKRIDVMPRRLNVPEDYTPTETNRIIDEGKFPDVTPIPVSLPEIAELFFATNKRRNLQFDRVPVGHDTGYRCFDASKHDSDSAFDSGEYGDGMSEDEAYVAWLSCVDEPVQRLRLVDGGAGVQPPEYKPEIYRDPNEDDAITFDDDLEDSK